MPLAEGAAYGLEQVEFRVGGWPGSEAAAGQGGLGRRTVAHQPGHPGADRHVRPACRR